MKKLVILLASVLTLASCGTTGSGALTGASFGGVIGSAIGGIIGGPRGSDIGTLIGMGTGAAVGGAAASAATKSSNAGTYDNYDDAVYYDPTANSSTQSSSIEYPTQDGDYAQAIQITNARFCNSDNTVHIAKGETTKIVFEIYNLTNEIQTNLVPSVNETTGNKRLSVSPAILLETLGAKKAVRYTAFITAADNLKTGNAHFVINIQNNGNIVSNTIELDVPLN